MAQFRRDKNGIDDFEIKSIVTSHALNYYSSERLFQIASLCFISFYFSLLTFLCTVSWLSERLERAIRVW